MKAGYSEQRGFSRRDSREVGLGGGVRRTPRPECGRGQWGCGAKWCLNPGGQACRVLWKAEASAAEAVFLEVCTGLSTDFKVHATQNLGM